MPRYDDPEFTSTRDLVIESLAGNANALRKFALFGNNILTRCRATIKVAGTSATTGSYFDIIVGGTATAGRIPTGSSTAGAILADVSLGNTVVPDGQYVSFVNGTDATAVAVAVIEYTKQPA